MRFTLLLILLNLLCTSAHANAPMPEPPEKNEQTKKVTSEVITFSFLWKNKPYEIRMTAPGPNMIPLGWSVEIRPGLRFHMDERMGVSMINTRTGRRLATGETHTCPGSNAQELFILWPHTTPKPSGLRIKQLCR